MIFSFIKFVKSNIICHFEIFGIIWCSLSIIKFSKILFSKSFHHSWRKLCGTSFYDDKIFSLVFRVLNFPEIVCWSIDCLQILETVAEIFLNKYIVKVSITYWFIYYKINVVVRDVTVTLKSKQVFKFDKF